MRNRAFSVRVSIICREAKPSGILMKRFATSCKDYFVTLTHENLRLKRYEHYYKERVEKFISATLFSNISVSTLKLLIPEPHDICNLILLHVILQFNNIFFNNSQNSLWLASAIELLTNYLIFFPEVVKGKSKFSLTKLQISFSCNQCRTTLTTSNAAPVDTLTASLTSGPRGAIALKVLYRTLFYYYVLDSVIVL